MTVQLNPEKIATLEGELSRIASQGRVALASSLGLEDQVLTDVIARLQLPIGIFVLNTGRLHAETLKLLAQTQAHYRLSFTVYSPQAQAVDTYTAAHGAFGFYESLALRKTCCAIRKTEPLKRALQGLSGWVTGQRREQAVTRNELALQEYDSAHGLQKYNPLADWSFAEINAYVDKYAVPINALHAKGYPSIGCEPCTRAIKPGEDLRAGRWWWEQADSKECGLHSQTTR